MGAGKIIAIIGGILGILSVVLYHLMPDLFNFWRIDGSPMFSITLGGFGFTSGWFLGVQITPIYAEDIFLLIIAILIVAGGVLALVGGLTGNKAINVYNIQDSTDAKVKERHKWYVDRSLNE